MLEELLTIAFCILVVILLPETRRVLYRARRNAAPATLHAGSPCSLELLRAQALTIARGAADAGHRALTRLRSSLRLGWSNPASRLAVLLGFWATFWMLSLVAAHGFAPVFDSVTSEASPHQTARCHQNQEVVLDGFRVGPRTGASVRKPIRWRCPYGGNWLVDDGRIECSRHGSFETPALDEAASRALEEALEAEPDAPRAGRERELEN